MTPPPDGGECLAPAVTDCTLVVGTSARTQVLFFTHHRHLVELARREVPVDSLQVLELPNDAP